MSIILDLRASYKHAETKEYSIGSKMFETIEKSLVKSGQLKAVITTVADAVGLDLKFQIKGNVTVECDRCLDDMQIGIECEESLKVQFSDRYEDTDEVIYVALNQTELDIWPFVYDFIALAIPLVHIHPDGECNQQMIDKLSQYMVTAANDEAED